MVYATLSTFSIKSATGGCLLLTVGIYVKSHNVHRHLVLKFSNLPETLPLVVARLTSNFEVVYFRWVAFLWNVITYVQLNIVHYSSESKYFDFPTFHFKRPLFGEMPHPERVEHLLSIKLDYLECLSEF